MKNALILLLVLTVVLVGGEVKFSRQAVTRVNSIKVDDAVLSIDKDGNQWVIRAQSGQEQRLVPVTPGGTDYVFLPGLILSVRNWNLARSNESWSIMQETIGEFEIQRLTADELSRGAPFAVSGNKELLLTNGHITMKCVPDYNGIVFSMRDNAAKRELFHAPAAAGALTLKSATGVGFVELIDSFGKTPEAAMNYSANDGKLVLTAQAKSVKDTIWSREMTMTPGAFAVSIRTSAAPANSACRTTLTIKHRPEFALPAAGMLGVNLMMVQPNGQLKAMSAQVNTAYETDEQFYCFADVNAGLLTGVWYENAGQLYVWCAQNYLAAEAFGKKTPVTEKPYMTANYFFVHGMSSADFISRNAVMKLSQTVLSGISGEAMKVTVTYGSAVALKAPVLRIAFSGKTNGEATVPLKALGAGYSECAEVALPVKSLPPGEYTLTLDLTDDGQSVVAGKIPLRLLSNNDLQQYQLLLRQIDTKIAEVRKSARGTDRRAKMKEFKELTLLRKKVEDAIKAGDFKTLEALRSKIK